MTPTLNLILQTALESAASGIRVAMPGRVVSYDATKQRAAVQPMIEDGFEAEGGERKTTILPTIPDVPVAFLGAGGYSETFPISKGDTVLLVFCSSSIARWKVKGGVLDPGDDRHHELSDAIAYAGVRDFAHALTGVPTDAWVITTPAGKQIRLGSASANQSALLGEQFLTQLSTLLSAIATAVGGISGSGAAAGAAITTAQNAFEAVAATYKASKVKVQ